MPKPELSPYRIERDGHWFLIQPPTRGQRKALACRAVGDSMHVGFELAFRLCVLETDLLPGRKRPPVSGDFGGGWADDDIDAAEEAACTLVIVGIGAEIVENAHILKADAKNSGSRGEAASPAPTRSSGEGATPAPSEAPPLPDSKGATATG